MATTYWIFDEGGDTEYTFERNPDRYGGDTYWRYQVRANEVSIVGSSSPSIQVDGFNGARRTIRFTAITGNMFRTLEAFWLNMEIIPNCKDHLYDTTPSFACFIESFIPTIHPTIGDFPGSTEDTWDLEMTIIRIL